MHPVRQEELSKDANGMPIRVFISKGTAADYKYASRLTEGIDADVLFAVRAYDTNAIIKQAANADMAIVIPSKKNRKEPIKHDEYLYTLRHLVENTFLMLKRWRGIATGRAKNSDSFLVAVQIRCLAICLNVLA